MLRWLKSLFAWHHAFYAGAWEYEFNGVTGQRRATTRFRGYSPLNMGWLLEGNGMPLVDGRPAWRSRYRNQLPKGWFWA
tara:strand:+ start:685 stop:921 length:237 start_codon:yes stop_codon:yes gene_type:complete